MFLKNRNIIFKIKISKVTDYAALTVIIRTVFLTNLHNLKGSYVGLAEYGPYHIGYNICLIIYIRILLMQSPREFSTKYQ